MLEIEIREHKAFKEWVRALKNKTDVIHIMSRIRRMSLNNFGDTKYLEDGVWELRIHRSPGFRVYYTMQQGCVVLLHGGSKRHQQRDIIKARAVLNAQDTPSS